MKTSLFTFCLLTFCLSLLIETFAQFNDKSFSLNASAVYTTTAEIFLNPNSSDIILRNESFELTDMLSPSFDFRYQLTKEVLIGVSTEYLKTSQKGSFLTVFAGSQIVNLEVEDGFEFIPIELSIYHLMPFSTELFKFTMGGGIGYYFAKQTRKFGNTDISNIETEPAFGIQVSAGLEYLLRSYLSLRFQMKFRAPEIKVKSKYNSSTVNYKGNTIEILQDTFDSKISVNGAMFSVGLSYLF